MPIAEPLPHPTYYQILLSDPEGSDAVELQRLLEDCGLNVLRVEELWWNDIELQSKRPSDTARLVQHTDRKAG